MTEPVATTAPPPLPPREGAVMPPLQGGPMLYTFPAAEPYDVNTMGDYDEPLYYKGLVNDRGEVIAEPRYESVQYLHDEYDQITGLLAYKGEELTWYLLDGTAKKMPFRSARVIPQHNGRYWIVETLGPGRGSSSYYAGTRDGLYDIKDDSFVFPPTDGLSLRAFDGFVFGNQYETSSYDSKHLRGFQWNPADGSTREFPLEWRCQGYFPETGWYEMVDYSNGSPPEIIIVDQDLNIVPGLRTEWHIDARFDGGNYLVVRSRYGGSVETWVDRNGTFSGLRYNSIQRRGRGYVAWISGSAWVGGESILLDGMLNILHKAQEGESFETFINQNSYDHSNAELIVLIDKDGKVRNAWNPETGKEMTMADKSGRWFHGGKAYKLEKGQWRVIEPSGWIILATDDLIIIRDGKWTEEGHWTDVTYSAIDWNGKPVNTPLAPFFANTDNRFSPAGPQGPNYYWVTLGDDSGYINEKGEWLFKR